eukprot:jgi/Undpi1/1852/HiC_scaffold_12.g05239.m1
MYLKEGGSEVAKYCAANICDVVKGTEAYQKGDLSLGLKQTFLRMDDLLRTPAGQVSHWTRATIEAELLTLRKESKGGGSDSDDEEEDELGDAEGISKMNPATQMQIVEQMQKALREQFRSKGMVQGGSGMGEDGTEDEDSDDEDYNEDDESEHDDDSKYSSHDDEEEEEEEGGGKDKEGGEQDGEGTGKEQKKAGDGEKREAGDEGKDALMKGAGAAKPKSPEANPAADDVGNPPEGDVGGGPGGLANGSTPHEDVAVATAAGGPAATPQAGDASTGSGEEGGEEVGAEGDDSALKVEVDGAGAAAVAESSARRRCGFDCGATAVMGLLVDGKTLVVANAGDSRCVVSRKGVAVDMSTDHKPEDDLELARIEKAGGAVVDGRVQGNLNLSRAIGDLMYKADENLTAEEQMITADPELRTLELTEEDEFMVLACDGVWNSLTSQETIDFVRTRLKDTGGDLPLSKVCSDLCDACCAKTADGDGTGLDNVTAVIVELNTDGARALAGGSASGSASGGGDREGVEEMDTSDDGKRKQGEPGGRSVKQMRAAEAEMTGSAAGP